MIAFEYSGPCFVDQRYFLRLLVTFHNSYEIYFEQYRLQTFVNRSAMRLRSPDWTIRSSRMMRLRPETSKKPFSSMSLGIRLLSSMPGIFVIISRYMGCHCPYHQTIRPGVRLMVASAFFRCFLIQTVFFSLSASSHNAGKRMFQNGRSIDRRRFVVMVITSMDVLYITLEIISF